MESKQTPFLRKSSTRFQRKNCAKLNYLHGLLLSINKAVFYLSCVNNGVFIDHEVS